jgi:signal transduction histidine kinase
VLKSRIADSQRLLAQAMNTVHDFARELRPAMLDDLGLVPALRWYLKEYAGRTGLRTRFQGSNEERLNGEQKTVLFRVAQESLTNVARHAYAESVEIVLSPVKQGIRMRIKDDGRGFRVNRQRSRRLGLLGIEERVRLVSGSLTIDSAPGKGTTVTVEIPFEEEKAAAFPGPVQRRGRAAVPLRAQFPESAIGAGAPRLARLPPKAALKNPRSGQAMTATRTDC